MANKTLLLVEDDDSTVRLVSDILRDAGVGSLVTVESGHEALVLLSEQHIDMTILDISLSGNLDGIETAYHVGREYNVPVFFLTSDIDDTTRSRALEQNPYGYVIKPVERYSFISAILVAMRLIESVRKEQYHYEQQNQAIERFRSIFNNALFGIGIHEMYFDEEGEPSDFLYINVNDAFCTQVGVTREAVVGKTAREIMVKSDPEPYIQQYGAMVKSKTPIIREIEMPALDRYYSVSAFPLQDNQFVVSFVDITAQKRLYDTLDYGQRKLKKAISLARLGYWELDFTEKTGWFSPRIYEMTGYPEGSYSESFESWQKLLRPEDLKKILPLVTERVAQGGGDTPLELDLPLQTQDGSERWVRTRSNMFDPQKQVVIGVMDDITSWKLTEGVLLDKMTFLENIVHSIMDPIAVISTDYEVIYTNAVMREWHVNLPERNQHCYNYFRNRDDICERCPSKRAMETGKPQMEVIQTVTTKTERWVELHAFPLRDHNNENAIVGAVEYARDITVQKNSEDKLKRGRDVLRYILAEMPSGVVVTDSGGVITFVNEAFLAMQNASEDQVLGRQLCTEVEVDLSYIFNSLTKEDVSAHNIETRLMKDGEATLQVRLMIHRFEKPISNEYSYVIFVSDISFEKRLEQKQVKLQAKIESTMNELDMLNEMLLDTGVYERSLAISAHDYDQTDREILQYLERGYSNKKIASQMNLAEVTIKKRLSRIYAKLGLKNRFELFEYLHSKGI